MSRALRVTAVALAVVATALFVAGVTGALERGACSDAGGRYDPAARACSAAPDVRYAPVARRPTLYSFWATSLGVAALLYRLGRPRPRRST